MKRSVRCGTVYIASTARRGGGIDCGDHRHLESAQCQAVSLSSVHCDLRWLVKTVNNNSGASFVVCRPHVS